MIRQVQSLNPDVLPLGATSTLAIMHGESCITRRQREMIAPSCRRPSSHLLHRLGTKRFSETSRSALFRKFSDGVARASIPREHNYAIRCFKTIGDRTCACRKPGLDGKSKWLFSTAVTLTFASW